ncbi:hypothetical protein [Cecembia lonarensis]|uniref:DUF5723 domain-containing protein n=1 Tax=Cecembia lonarensis (strain CCUG 58316 / KCTC 22772 / LW9) TaxID=1225176 RepID=K1LE19_CECL9|nr:hypothetical protein [Cecembia lonarensis]EKB50417.1 hypothetical protein B879_00966 [Cecembia lonarensis LW9]
MHQKFIIIVFSLLSSNFLFAQNSFIGIQNSHRKSMHSILMNPAEIGNLGKKVEVNFFSVQGSVSNNILSFQDVINNPDDILDFTFQRANGPVNLRTNVEIVGPSVGFKWKRWGFGITSQSFASGHIIDLDPKLGESISSERLENSFNTFGINSPYNQRINLSGWTELGFTAGLEIFQLAAHSISVGSTFKLLFPYFYTNVGLDRINGTLIQENDEFYLTNTIGSAYFSYSNDLVDNNNLTFSASPFNFSNLNGLGLDLGANYKWQDQNVTKINAGLTIRNIGGMTLGANQTNTTYNVNIPGNERFRLDNLGGNLDDIERQIVESGYFALERQEEGLRAALPTLIAAYGEIRLSKLFYLSLYGQQKFGSTNRDEQLIAQNLLAITPRLMLGNFEIYSPWISYEVAGITGGLGLRFGGLFIGSHSVLTGLISDTKQADIHAGFSWGFGR